RPACPVTYVVAAADRLSPPPLQRTFAHRLDARVREYPGGHLAALAAPRFLRAPIESNNLIDKAKNTRFFIAMI
ncbi:hypothetical protein Q2415_25925, partial [Escherichia coli]|nr:hypothetical protein [Escherichia coli]